MAKFVKTVGSRGDWLASVDGERLPVLHNAWLAGASYSDPMEGVETAGKRYTDFVAALVAGGRAVLRKDRAAGDLGRDGYIAVFRYSGLEVDRSGPVRLKLIERLDEPKG